jgi:transcriptional regulator with XRE-family HTH domain
MPGPKDDTAEPDPLSVALGARVVTIRRDRLQLSQQELAVRMGVSPAYLWRIEDGRQNISLRTLGRLARSLEVTLADLFDGVDAEGVALTNRDYVRR